MHSKADGLDLFVYQLLEDTTYGPKLCTAYGAAPIEADNTYTFQKHLSIYVFVDVGFKYHHSNDKEPK